MKLLIVESPNKTKKIGKILGQGWQVMASFGHIRDLPLKELGVASPDFKPHYEISKKASGHVSKLRQAAKTATEVYLATDPDREGEAISWHLEQVLRLKSPKRVTFQEITQTAVLKAIANPRQIDYKLVSAQEGRRVADRLVGYMVSPSLSAKAEQRLSAGRVQSVAVRLVVERERAIEAFVPVKYFGVRLAFAAGDVNWFADWDAASMLPKGVEYLRDFAYATRLSQVRQLTVESVEKKDSRSAAPPPFITSTLQQAASVSLGMSPKETMRHAQALFEEGLITYHRTDSQNLSDEAISEIRDWLAQNGFSQELPSSPNRWKSKEGAQEAHEAIRPTAVNNRTPVLSDTDQAKLYRLIWDRAVASQMIPATYEVTTIRLLSDESIDGHKQPFVSKGRIPKVLGWQRLTSRDSAVDQGDAEDNDEQQLPALNKGQAVRAIDGKVLDRETKPPARYTEASLIKKMESEGVGRPSTYASILDNIISRGYVDIVKKKLHGAVLGKAVNDALVGQFGFMELAYTRGLEEDLDKIARGTESYQSIIAALHAQLSRELNTLTTVDIAPVASHPCPQCGKNMKRIKGAKGYFWGCSGYPDCKTTLPDAKGKPGAKQAEKTGQPCPACQKPLVLRKGKNGPFWGCSGYPDCTQTMPVLDGSGKAKTKKFPAKRSSGNSNSAAGVNCPTCSKGQLVKRFVKNGDNAGKPFLGCNRYPQCKHFSWPN